MADLKSFDSEALVQRVRAEANKAIDTIREQAVMLAVATDVIALNGIIAGASVAHLKDFIVDPHTENGIRTSFALRGLTGVRGYGYNEIELSSGSIDLAPGAYRVLVIITKVEGKGQTP